MPTSVPASSDATRCSLQWSAEPAGFQSKLLVGQRYGKRTWGNGPLPIVPATSSGEDRFSGPERTGNRPPAVHVSRFETAPATPASCASINEVSSGRMGEKWAAQQNAGRSPQTAWLVT